MNDAVGAPTRRKPMRLTLPGSCARADWARDHRASQCDDELPAVHSITSSARAKAAGGISKPSVLAVLRLTTNSNLVA
jgi:hypothetical protein